MEYCVLPLIWERGKWRKKNKVVDLFSSQTKNSRTFCLKTYFRMPWLWIPLPYFKQFIWKKNLFSSKVFVKILNKKTHKFWKQTCFSQQFLSSVLLAVQEMTTTSDSTTRNWIWNVKENVFDFLFFHHFLFLKYFQNVKTSSRAIVFLISHFLVKLKPRQLN